MLITKCYKFRLKPNNQQIEKFVRFAGCRGYVYNWALDKKSTYYKNIKETLNYNALACMLVNLKKQPYTLFLKKRYSQILQQSFMYLKRSFKAFFWKIGSYTKFKSKKASAPTFRITQNVKIIDNSVDIPKACNVCKHNRVLTLFDRAWIYENCRTIHDKYINASINIKEESVNNYWL